MSMIYLAQNEYHKYQQILLHIHDELDKLNSKTDEGFSSKLVLSKGRKRRNIESKLRM